MKKNNKDNLLWIIFMLFGGVFFAIGMIVCVNTFNYNNKITTTGTITRITSHTDSDGDTDHEVYVSYEADGTKYESKLNGYSSSFKEGKEIEIYYDKDNHAKIGSKTLDKLFVMFPGFGLVFFLIGLIGFIVKLLNKNNSNKLKMNGELIYADFIDGIVNEAYTVNGRHPYKVICSWTDPTDNSIYEFKSDNIWTDVNPKYVIEQRGLKQVRVYVNPSNKKKYYVDLEDIFETNDPK